MNGKPRALNNRGAGMRKRGEQDCADEPAKRTSQKDETRITAASAAGLLQLPKVTDPNGHDLANL